MRKKQLLKKVGVTTLAMLIVSANILFSNDMFNISAAGYEIEVDKDNVTDKFNFNGTASYDQDSGIATLTEDEAGQSGNITINEKISLSDAFSLTLDINIGNKPQGGQGGDGMAFFFHTGEVTDVGSFGNAFGAGFLSDVVGFKIDTTNNSHDEGYINAVADPNRVWWDEGISINRTGNWYGYNNSVYGAFFYSNPNNNDAITTWGDLAYNTPHNRNGDDDIKGLSNPENNDFKEITIDYDGNGIMSVNYDGEYWEIDIVSTFNMDLDDEYVFTISGSTGEFTNYHQVKFGDITYVPSVDNGQVIVKYENEAGTEIANSVTLVGEIGTTYTTTQKAIDNYTFKEMKVGSAATSGTYIDGSLTVTYVYEACAITQGTVIAKYENEAGTEIADSVTTTGNVGSAYTTTQKTIDNYTFKEMKVGSAATSGTYTDGTLTVTYVYETTAIAQGTVVAKYENEAGTEIADSVTTTGNVGSAYTTTQKTIDNYTFKEMKVGSAAASGNYTNGTLTVTYVYETTAVAQGTVIAKYENEAGAEIASSVTTSGNVGSAYTTTQKTIDNYTFKEMKVGSAATSGNYTNGTLTVTYVYEATMIAQGTVIAKYENESGTEIADSVTTTGYVATPYTTTQKTIDNYTFKEMKAGSAATSGNYTSETQTVTYVYETTAVAQGTIIAKYENESGTEIADSVTTTGNVGSAYATTQKTIANYTFKEMKAGSAATSGNYTSGTQTVTYVYETTAVAQGMVITKYENELGTEIADSVTTTGNVGSAYATTQKTIANYTFKEMKAGSAATSGNYTNGTQTVTYVYETTAVAQGTVIARYEDELGNEIASSVTTSSDVGNSYTTIQKLISGYTFKEMKIGSANTSGSYINGMLTVTYVYKETIITIAQGSVISKYVDQLGNEIATSVTTTGDVGTNYATQKKDISGYTYSNLHQSSASVTGNYTNGIQTVIYVYTRDSGKLIVRHEDSDGKALEDETVSVKNTGETYTTSQKEFDGYVFKEVKAGSHDQQGVYEKDITKVVTYVYELEDEDKTVVFTPSIASPSGNPSVAISTGDSSNTSFYLLLMILAGGIIIVRKVKKQY